MENSSGAGSQGAANNSDFAGEYNAMLFMIRRVLSKVNVAALCEVLAVYGGGVGAVGYVDLQPLVNQVDGSGKAIPQGVLHNIPYMRMQGGANAIILDPQKGDIGAAVFSDRDISSVKATGAQANPGSRRRFDVADGLYFGGMLNGTPTQYIEFLANAINIVSPSEIILIAPEINLSSWVGMLAPFSMSAIPDGWLACPTAQTLVSTTTYADLFNAYGGAGGGGYTWGGSGGSFGIPYFESGYIPLNGVTVGQVSHGTVKDHTHDVLNVSGVTVDHNTYGTGGASNYDIPSTRTSNTPNSPEGGADNLAAGRGVVWCVKY
jgi:hypothetical protein